MKQRSCGQFWLKIFVSFLFGGGMPPIAPTAVAALREVAESWRRNHLGLDPLQIPAAEREGSAQAKAAYFIARLGSREVPANCGSCSWCGEITSSWCEGCYERSGVTGSYSSVCQRCDSQQRVCDLCTHLKITYSQGHAAYRLQWEQGRTDAVEVQLDTD